MNYKGVGAALVLLLAGCAVSYQPTLVSHPTPLAGDAFERVVSVLHERYGGLPIADPESFRLQTEWVPFQRGNDAPGRRRATVYRDADGQLRVLVEVRFIRLGFDGLPMTTSSTGDAGEERELAGILEGILISLRETRR